MAETTAERERKAAAQAESKAFKSLNYVRMLADLAIFLVIVILIGNKRVLGTGANGFKYDDEHLLYKMQRADVRELYKTTFKKPLAAFDNNTFYDALQCSSITGHEMCTCVGAATSWKETRSCLINQPFPMQLHSQHHISLLAVVVVWFGTMCGASWMINGFEAGVEMCSNRQHSWMPKFTFATGLLVAVGTFVAGLVLGCLNDGSENYLLLYSVFWLVTVVTFGTLHYEKFERVWKIVSTTKPGSSTDNKLEFYESQTTREFLFYFCLLIAAPAMVIVLHLSHHWYDFDQLANSIFIVMGIVSVDAFVMHLTTHWEMSPHWVNLNHSKTVRVGVIKMFGWIVNVVSVYLLITINYPSIVDEPIFSYGLYAMFLLFLGLTIVLPDIVREFTHVYTLHALKFRIWGEFILRGGAIIYVVYHMYHHIDEGDKWVHS